MNFEPNWFKWGFNCSIFIITLFTAMFGTNCVNINEEAENTCLRNSDSVACAVKRTFRPR